MLEKHFPTLEKYNFSERRSRQVYDWDAHFDGKVYHVERGVHFNCTPVTMVSNIRNAARQRGIDLSRVRVEISKKDKGVVVFQIIPDPAGGNSLPRKSKK